MGIDIYIDWDGMTEEEEKARYQGFDTTIGFRGYLREAYHGEPYATHYLVREAFTGETSEVVIDATTLRERLPETLDIHVERMSAVYNEAVTWESPSAESFTAFVELAERLEKAGKNPRIIASY